ncbi:MAG: hypothetical protein JW806_04445 [Sedimentisphaerales bacterium]|nr:hypothetical protein [Sedimentisphaerales bacterium]
MKLIFKNKYQVRYKMIVLLFVIMAISSSVFSESADVERNIPVSMSIYRDDYPSSLYIKCKVQDFSKIDIDSFQDGGDLTKKEFKRLIKSIKDNDPNSYESFGKNYRNKVYNNETTKKANSNLRGFQQVFQYYEEHGDGLKVYKKVSIGNGGLFVFGTDAKSTNSEFKDQRRSFRYEEASSDKIRWNSAEQLMDPLSSIIVNTFQEAARNPEKWQGKVADVNTSFDYSILIAGTEDKNPVYLQFNGAKYNIDIINDSIPDNDKILGFYQDAHLVWLHVSSEEYMKYYTHSSQERILNTEAKSPGFLDDIRKSLSKGKKVLFVMDANPFYVIFYRLGDVNKTVYHEYVVIDPNDGALKLNLATMDYNNQYLLSPEFSLVLNKIDSDLFPVDATQ